MTRPPTTSPLPEWAASVSRGASQGGRLLGALFTTFDPPEASHLVEDVLPDLLGLTRRASDLQAEEALFLTELHERLKRLVGKITVVSSTPRSAEPAHWLWGLVRRLHVGANGPAVQHAKLWMLHRGPGHGGAADDPAPETLEIVVSSLNLTRNAFRHQIQAGWRAVLPLEARASAQRTRAWGVLPAFLEALTAACGPGAHSHLEPWLKVLGRATPPSDVRFVGSIPRSPIPRGSARGGPAWGARALRKALGPSAGPPQVQILVPTIGDWTVATVREWARDLGVSPERLTLGWVAPDHPWAPAWSVSPTALKALREAGVRIVALPGPLEVGVESPSWLHERHKGMDPRWSHAKLYWCASGRKRRVLVTSANLSPSAWGLRKGRGPGGGNFELGVLVPAAELPVRDLDILETPSVQERSDEPLSEGLLWGEAQWDGTWLQVVVRLLQRTSGMVERLRVYDAGGSAQEATVDCAWHEEGELLATRVAWPASCGLPVQVGASSSDGGEVGLPVYDARGEDEIAQCACPAIEEELALELRARLLEERYGYRTVDGDDVSGEDDTSNEEEGPLPEVRPTSDYAVPAFEEARRRFATVNVWAERLDGANETERAWVLRDGAELARLWSRLAAAALERGEANRPAKLAAEELHLRVKEGSHER